MYTYAISAGNSSKLPGKAFSSSVCVSCVHIHEVLCGCVCKQFIVLTWLLFCNVPFVVCMWYSSQLISHVQYPHKLFGVGKLEMNDSVGNFKESVG